MQIGRVRICASAPAIGQSPSELAQPPLPSPLILIRSEMNFCMGRESKKQAGREDLAKLDLSCATVLCAQR